MAERVLYVRVAHIDVPNMPPSGKFGWLTATAESVMPVKPCLPTREEGLEFYLQRVGFPKDSIQQLMEALVKQFGDWVVDDAEILANFEDDEMRDTATFNVVLVGFELRSFAKVSFELTGKQPRVTAA